MTQITNITNVSLPLAVWLASDGYDFDRGSRKAISATALLRSTRQILLSERLSEDTRVTPDVTDYIASRMGHSIHDSIERSWKEDYRGAMRKLGFPEKTISRILINPEPGTDLANKIPIYIEQRTERQFKGYAITGKFDMVLDGVIQDFKSTSVYALMKGDKDEQYQLQGSIYRWLNQDKVTADHMVINFIFTDWSRAEAQRNPNYPQQRVLPHRIELLSNQETETWLSNKIAALEAAADLPEPELPFCTDKELWRGDAVWKYYSDPAKANDPTARSTRNFDNAAEANGFKATKGGKGVVIEVPGKVKACNYCPAFPICTQRDLYDLS